MIQIFKEGKEPLHPKNNKPARAAETTTKTTTTITIDINEGNSTSTTPTSSSLVQNNAVSLRLLQSREPKLQYLFVTNKHHSFMKLQSYKGNCLGAVWIYFFGGFWIRKQIWLGGVCKGKALKTFSFNTSKKKIWVLHSTIYYFLRMLIGKTVLGPATLITQDCLRRGPTHLSQKPTL